MKKITLLSILIVLYNIILAQEITVRESDKANFYPRLPLTNEQMFKQADFIFEGRLIANSCESYDVLNDLDRKEGFYTSSIIEVKHIYKGGDKITKGTLEIIEKGGIIYAKNEMGWTVPYETFPINERVEVGTNNDAVFFCKESKFPQNPNPRTLDNKISVSHFIDKPFAVLRIDAIDWPIKYSNYIRGLNYLSFSNRAKFYEYLNQFKNLNIPIIKDSLKKENSSIEKMKKQKQLLKTFKEEQKKLKKVARNNKKKLINKGVSTYSTLTLEIQGQTVTGNGPYFFEFDVMAKANNSSTYYYNSIFRLNFNTDAFGTDLVSQGKITVTKGAQFNNSVYYTTPYDVSAAEVNLGLHVSYNNSNNQGVLTRLTTTPQQLVHVKIKLLPEINNILSNLSFVDIVNTADYSVYSESSLLTQDSWNNALFYDNTYYINPPKYNIFPTPIITTDLSKIHVRAGVGDILTINGKNFGSQKGKVLFSSADKGGFKNDGRVAYLHGLNDNYIISWSDTKIRVKVPSRVTEGYNGISDGAGTGKIKIITALGAKGESSTSLNIDYSITNYGNGSTYPFDKVYLAKNNCIDGMVFTLHSSLQNNTAAINVIESVLFKWSNLLGIDLILEKDENNEYIIETNNSLVGKNVISINHERSCGMATVPSYTVGSVNPYKYYRSSKSDIQIAPVNVINGNYYAWDYSTSGNIPSNKVSFYNAFLHEIGHIVSLGHINTPLDLMYYSIGLGGSIINLTSENIYVQAAKTTINNSENINWILPTIGTLNTIYERPYIYCDMTTICDGNPVELECTYSDVPNFTPNKDLVWTLGYKGESMHTYTPGIYSVTAKYQGCALTSEPINIDRMKIEVNEGPFPFIYSTSIIGGVPPYSYQWTFEYNNQFYSSNSKDLDFIVLPARIYDPYTLNYWLNVTDTEGCQASWTNTDPFWIDIIKGKKSKLNSGLVNIYPNPSSGEVNINALNYLKSEIYDTRNILVKKSLSKQIDLNNLPRGVYFIKVFTKNGINFEKLILK